MKKLLILTCVTILYAINGTATKAQYLPVVYNNTYSGATSITQTLPIANNGDVFATAISDGKPVCMWLNRVGEIEFTREFTSDEFFIINKAVALTNSSVLVVGNKQVGKKNKSKTIGKAIVLNSDGTIVQEFTIGDTTTAVSDGAKLLDGDFVFWGTQQTKDGISKGYICKYAPDGKLRYEYLSSQSGVCSIVQEDQGISSVVAVFNSYGSDGASIVKLDKFGMPEFITILADKSFVVEDIKLINGYTYITGMGNNTGGTIIKIRPEGDIVYQKQIITNTMNASLNKLVVTESGNLLVGGNDISSAIFYILRQDGTTIANITLPGTITAIASNPQNGDISLAQYDSNSKSGNIIKLNSSGKTLYHKSTFAHYGSIKMTPNGDILLGSVESGRISMMSSYGELLFDKYIDENRIIDYTNILMTNSGEVILTDSKSNITKLAHGIYINDITITKPTNGFATAIFTVSLTGYSFSPENAPIATTVQYRTAEKSANTLNNFNAVSGTLSFIPNKTDGSRYTHTQVIEVPIKANNYIEGVKEFVVALSNVHNSYIIKGDGLGTIEDQHCYVDMINSTNGIEGGKSVQFELGLFKSNDVALTNTTGSNIIVDGKFGDGTADQLDYNYNTLPRLVIANGSHSSTVDIATLEDNRYEIAKTLFVNFDKISSVSDISISFQGAQLVCESSIYDQPACLSITSLGDQSQLNNMVSGFAKITLLRAKDGVVQTNNSGFDIDIEVNIDPSSSAKSGVDFALVNSHDLKIIGDDERSGINLNGIVLHNADTKGDKELIINIERVMQIPQAGLINLCANKKQCSLMIK